ncbi:peptidyl-alpha-hydroxyglycine alpha-amidating lyase family protein [Erythrobacter sp. sf7]|uniref:Peptidyl-alpha-hydroxyglycine alpha-amidating lyase family protein n=1 Tax=Erythrobacter fulvus TaxID=2987523 RepID=A0ABT5JLJ3_9SPHN|nr:peptidyl-alpha-hydroxyglycine alpha-amidating lyase family protein [Erythrobacter fulvus]MDC8753040.1 peptidyl-alpha-hydroxyglycine alpha-amidating lyase family protein [Erythrobacter fulvus]
MRRALALLAVLALAACDVAAPPPPREDVPVLAVDTGWPTIPAGIPFGEVSAVDVDAEGNVWVLHRAGRVWEEPFPTTPITDPTVFKFAPDGTLLAQWGEGLFIMPHGLSVDDAGKVWITDVAHEQVFRFSPEGVEELAIGTRGVTVQDATHFGRPADVAFLGDRVLVADGYVNTRVAEFSPEGKFIRDWGDFKVAHAVAVDEAHIYVADRENARIQIYDHDAKLVESRVSPAGNHTYSLKPLGGGRLLAVEGRDGADRKGAVIRIYAADGSVEASYDISLPGEDASLGHDLAIGPDGHIYVTDVPGGRVVRFSLPSNSDE